MRFIHTSDWHIGRLFHGLHLTEDQAFVLQQFIDLAKHAKPDVILVAGDVFDRAVPPPEAVAVVDNVLCELALNLRIPVVLIAGNHDSPRRLEFGSRLLAKQGLHIVGNAAGNITVIPVEDDSGIVQIYAIPYAEPPVWRESLADADIHDHNTAMHSVLRSLGGIGSNGGRTIALVHAAVLGGEESESERPLSIGGASTVDAACFQPFTYVAMGHLHRPQAMDGDRIHYPGSLMKYSFAEADHTKTVHVVEMDASGKCAVELVSLKPRYDVRCIKGMMDEILKGPQDGQNKDDYVHVMLDDTGPILDPIGKIRQVYRNVLAVERAILSVEHHGSGERMDHRKVSEKELFTAFFCEVTGAAVTEAEIGAFSSVAATCSWP